MTRVIHTTILESPMLYFQWKLCETLRCMKILINLFIERLINLFWLTHCTVLLNHDNAWSVPITASGEFLSIKSENFTVLLQPISTRFLFQLDKSSPSTRFRLGAETIYFDVHLACPINSWHFTVNVNILTPLANKETQKVGLQFLLAYPKVTRDPSVVPGGFIGKQ